MSQKRKARPAGSTQRRWLGLLAATGLFVSCLGQHQLAGFGSGPSLKPVRVELGRQLFSETRLSADGAMSCATCHVPELGFADGRRHAIGRDGKVLPRHTPSLFNVVENERFFWDGRADSLEEQALTVIESPDEFNTSLESIVQRLGEDEAYIAGFDEAFPGSGLTGANVLQALTDFERSLTAYNSPYDRHQAGDETALSPAAKRGLELFEGNAGCVLCHRGPNFTDGEFHNTGVDTRDRGRIDVQRNVSFRMRPYPFFAHYKAFKTPTLRNVALTAPYFHNGSVSSLEGVVRFYNVGGVSKDPYGRSPDVQPLDLNEEEIACLVAFLESLTELGAVPAR